MSDISYYQVGKSMGPVLVQWDDASGYPGWHRWDGTELKAAEMLSVGWLLKRDEDTLVLAMSTSVSKVGDVLVIPAGCVKSVRVYRPPIASRETSNAEGVET